MIVCRGTPRNIGCCPSPRYHSNNLCVAKIRPMAAPPTMKCARKTYRDTSASPVISLIFSQRVGIASFRQDGGNREHAEPADSTVMLLAWLLERFPAELN